MRLSGILPGIFLFALLLSADQAGAGADTAPVSASDAGAAALAPVPDMAEIKKMEVERLRVMAEAGAIPRARLDQARAELADALDNTILRRTLYGSVRVEDFTKDQAEEMVNAAQRLVDRQAERYEHSKELVQQGVIARGSLTAMLEDLEFRRKALDLARFRANLVDELAQYARAEEAVDDNAGVQMSAGRIIERFNGVGLFSDLDYLRISTAFQRQFARILPVSARGETATHRALGFDHRGRVDIALNPDQREGIWLRSYLKLHKLPYFAFRAAVPGKATAPHIHLGPPSLRLRIAD